MPVPAFDLGKSVRAARARLRVASFVPVAAAAGSMLVAAFGYATGGVGAWAYATDLVLRFATLLYIFAFAFGPAARFIAGRETAPIAHFSRMMLLGFAAGYGVFLLCVVVPFLFGGEDIPAATAGFFFFDGFILAVLAATALPEARRMPGARIAETFHRLSVAFFWVAFTIGDFAHLYGPHRPDRFYGISLCLLLCALLVRFADAIAAKVRLAEKVG